MNKLFTFLVLYKPKTSKRFLLPLKPKNKLYLVDVAQHYESQFPFCQNPLNITYVKKIERIISHLFFVEWLYKHFLSLEVSRKPETLLKNFNIILSRKLPTNQGMEYLWESQIPPCSQLNHVILYFFLWLSR